MLTETEFDNKIDISIDKRRIVVKSSNKRAKKILANNIKRLLPSTNLVFDDNYIHNEDLWKEKVYDALNYLIL